MRHLCFLLGGFMVTACGHAQGPGEIPDLGALVSAEAPLETVLETYVSGADAARTGVITTADAWRTAWAAVHRHQLPPPEAPAVDFARRSVVLDGLGPTTDGAMNRITRVRVHERGVVVEVTVTVPGRHCVIVQVVGSPVHAVSVPQVPAGLTAYAQRTRVVRECE